MYLLLLKFNCIYVGYFIYPKSKMKDKMNHKIKTQFVENINKYYKSSTFMLNSLKCYAKYKSPIYIMTLIN